MRGLHGVSKTKVHVLQQEYYQCYLPCLRTAQQIYSIVLAGCELLAHAPVSFKRD